MKIIFVGIHNKPGKEPLCSSTKTGKIIDRIIIDLSTGWTGPDWWLKTNLYNLEAMPVEETKNKEAVNFFYRIRPSDGDIFVLLGSEVANNFFNKGAHNVIEIHHPASKRSKIEIENYIKNTVTEINRLILSL